MYAWPYTYILVYTLPTATTLWHSDEHIEVSASPDGNKLLQPYGTGKYEPKVVFEKHQEKESGMGSTVSLRCGEERARRSNVVLVEVPAVRGLPESLERQSGI